MPDVMTEAARKREAARIKVATAARGGQLPSVAFSEEDLKWAFRDHEDELEQLERHAIAVHRAEASRQERRERSEELAEETERVLAEWDTQRRRDAETEARKRLGLDA